MNKIVEMADLKHLLSARAHVPDHSLLSLTVELSSAVTERLCGNTLGCKELKKGKVFRKVVEQYMESETTNRLLNSMLTELATLEKHQDDMDQCFEGLVNFLLCKATESMKGRSKKQPRTKYKPYWDDDLSKKWKCMKEAERIYHDFWKCHKGMVNTCLQTEFKVAQKTFDKELKVKKRKFHHGQMIIIDKCLVSDPQVFWAHIKNLGPTKKQTIPMGVEINGHIVTDQNLVLDKWRSEYELLYNAAEDGCFDQVFKKAQMELLTEEDFEVKL